MSSSRTITFSIEAVKTKNSLLKIFETILGATCLGMIMTSRVPVEAILAFDLFFLVVVTTLFGTFILLLSYIISPDTAGTLSKTIYEFLHHAFAFLLYLGTSIAFFVMLAKREYFTLDKPAATAVLGLVNSILYLMSTLLSYKAFKGLA